MVSKTPASTAPHDPAPNVHEAPGLLAIRRVMAAMQELASALGDDVVQAKVAPAPRDQLRPRALCPGCPV
jgi:hypothetical protein